jgi:hypothetical protein
MGLKQDYTVGRTVEHNQDATMGVIQQNADSTSGSMTARTASDHVQYGVPITVVATATLAADGTDTVLVFNANCPAKYRIIDAIYYMRSHRTGGTPAHTLKLTNGTNDITDTADVDAAASGTVNQPYRFGTIDDAYDTIDVDETLDLDLVVSGTTTGGTALCEVVITLLPVKIG